MGGSLTNLLLELPKIRQQQALLAAHQQLYGAQVGLYQAEAEHARAQIPAVQAQTQLYTAEANRATAQKGTYEAESRFHNAQADELVHEDTARADLGNAFLALSNAQQSGQPIGPHVSNAVNALARLSRNDQSSIARTLAQMLEMDKPRTRTAMALGAHMDPISVGPGSALIDPMAQDPGTPMYQSPRILNYGQQMFPGAGGGAPLATGQDRPIMEQHYGNVLGAFAAQAAEVARREGAPMGTALQNFMQTVNSLNPDFGNRLIRSQGTNAPVAPGTKRRYWNPATGLPQDTPP